MSHLYGISKEWLNILPSSDDIISKLPSDITPNIESIFEFARLTPLSEIKIVILGQDPYPKAGEAHGLAFSCLRGIPASLRNIYKCLLKYKLLDKMPTSGDLTPWAKKGILLLNCSLTTKIGESNSHKVLWEPYTDELIKRLDNNNIIFLLWGLQANKKAPLIKKAKILSWSHPSPLAQSIKSFIECDHFKILTEEYSINWQLDNESNKSNEPKTLISPNKKQPTIEQRFSLHDRKTIIFTDGSCYPNRACEESIAGYSVYFALGKFCNTAICGSIHTDKYFATNQRAEGLAIYHAMNYLSKSSTDWSECCIITDSEFWIKMLTVYMPQWNKKNISFDDKKNSDITKNIWRKYNQLLIEDKNIEFLHIKSHGKSGWGKYPVDSYEYFCYKSNETADELANYARRSIPIGKNVIKHLK